MSGSVWGAACDTRVEQGFASLNTSEINNPINQINQACISGATSATVYSAYTQATEFLTFAQIQQIQSEMKTTTVNIYLNGMQCSGSADSWYVGSRNAQESLWDFMNNNFSTNPTLNQIQNWLTDGQMTVTLATNPTNLLASVV